MARLHFRRTRGEAASPPERTSACNAPAVALQFSFTGKAHACCQNGNYALGDVRTDTLEEIWNGLPRRLMAESLAEGVYPPGCELCEVQHAAGNRRATPAQAFDRFPSTSEWPRQMEFTLSNRCNLECVHCNGDNSSTIRKRREGRPPMEMPYDDSFFEQLEPFLEHLEVAAFLGGEPFLAPEARRIWDMFLTRGLLPEVQVTTNATVWNAKVERYVYDLQMHMAVSIDGATKETYEAIRGHARYEQVIENRDRLLAATRSYGAYFQLNYCLLRDNAHELGAFLLQADELDVHANIIPVFGPAGHSVFSLPLEPLDRLVGALHDEGASLRSRLGRNGPVWDQTLRMIEMELDKRRGTGGDDTVTVDARSRWDTEPVPVPVVLTALPRNEVRRASREAESDLRAWAGRECIEITEAEGRVLAVQSPDWAAPLAMQQWVGSELDALLGAVTERLGAIDSHLTWTIAPGLVQSETVFGAPGGPVRVRSLHFELPGRVLIASPDPIPVL